MSFYGILWARGDILSKWKKGKNLLHCNQYVFFKIRGIFNIFCVVDFLNKNVRLSTFAHLYILLKSHIADKHSALISVGALQKHSVHCQNSSLIATNIHECIGFPNKYINYKTITLNSHVCI